MSLRYRKTDSQGRIHYYLVPFDPMLFLIAIGMCLGMLIPIVLTAREFVHRWPTGIALVIALSLASGFAMFAVAKASVIRQGIHFSFGPSPMTAPMRRLYYCGYALMGCAVFLAVPFLTLTRY